MLLKAVFRSQLEWGSCEGLSTERPMDTTGRQFSHSTYINPKTCLSSVLTALIHWTPISKYTVSNESVIILLPSLFFASPAPPGGIVSPEKGLPSPGHVFFTVGTPPDGHTPPSTSRPRHSSGERLLKSAADLFQHLKCHPDCIFIGILQGNQIKHANQIKIE